MRRRRLGTALAALLLLAAAACGGDDPSTASDSGDDTSSAEGTPSDSASPTETPTETPTEEPTEEPSASPSEGSDVAAATFGTDLIEAQLEAGSVHMEADIDAAGQTVEMSGDMSVTPGDVALDMTISGAGLGGGGRFLLVDEVLYLKFEATGLGDKFLEIDPKDRSNPMAQSFGDLLNSIDPSRTLAGFEAITKLKAVGQESVGGVETTKYAVSVDTEKAFAAQGIEAPPGPLPDQLDYTVWVDGDNLLRKFVFEQQGAVIEMTFSDWGEPVQIVAPPRSQITAFPQAPG